jgi:hypothetical protein
MGPASRIEARMLAHRVEFLCPDLTGLNFQRIGISPVGRRPHGADKLDQGLGVENPRDVLEGDPVTGQQGGRNNRKGGVFVTGRLD